MKKTTRVRKRRRRKKIKIKINPKDEDIIEGDLSVRYVSKRKLKRKLTDLRRK